MSNVVTTPASSLASCSSPSLTGRPSSPAQSRASSSSALHVSVRKASHSSASSESGSEVSGVPALTAGEHCVLAASWVVGGGGDGDVRGPMSSCMARGLTPGCCSSMQGPMSRSTLAFFPAIPSSSTSSKWCSSSSIEGSGPAPSRCARAFVLASSPGVESGSARATPSGVYAFGSSECPNSLVSASHSAFAVLWRRVASKTQSGSFPDRSCRAAASSRAHSFMASVSVLVGLATSLGVGRVAVPSKWAQQWVTHIIASKRAAKAAQLLPSSLRCGTVGRRVGKGIMTVAFYAVRAGPITCCKSAF